MIRKAIFLLCLVMLYGSLFSQEKRQQLERFVLVMKSGERLQGASGWINPSRITGSTLAGKAFDVPCDSARSLYVYNGSQAVLMGVLGGAVGLVVGLSASSSPGNDQSTHVSSETLIALSAGGALVGVLLGSHIESWTSFPLPCRDP